MPGHSGQNFLRLLFGGLDQGIDNFSRGQERQQDLAMNLHQMQARQSEADRAHDFRVDQFEAAQAARSAEQARQGNIDISNTTRQFKADAQGRFNEQRRRFESDRKFGLDEARVNAQVKANEALASQRYLKADGSVDWGKFRGGVLRGLFNRTDMLGEPIPPPTIEEVRELESLIDTMQANDKNQRFQKAALAGGAKRAKTTQDESMEAEIARLKKELGKN